MGRLSTRGRQYLKIRVYVSATSYGASCRTSHVAANVCRDPNGGIASRRKFLGERKSQRSVTTSSGMSGASRTAGSSGLSRLGGAASVGTANASDTGG